MFERKNDSSVGALELRGKSWSAGITKSLADKRPPSLDVDLAIKLGKSAYVTKIPSHLFIAAQFLYFPSE
jgi:hypothetical protein